LADARIKLAGTGRGGMIDPKQQIERSLELVELWVERHAYRGYEPFDGLTSYLYPLTLKNRFACQVLQQGVRRFPVNIRPLLGIKPLDSTKGRGYVAWGYLRRFQLNNDPKYREKALACLDWLDNNRSALYSEHSWGNHFFYASRSGFIGKHESTIVWTGLIGQVFLEAYGLFRHPRHLEIIESIAEWIMALPREQTAKGLCLSYVMPRQSSIHNSNMIGAAFLAGAAAVTGKGEYLEVARRALEYSCASQLPNGAWYYGEDPMFHWIDVFHTGYNLDSLKRYIQFSHDSSFDENLNRGFAHFKESYFEPSGRVKYYFNKTPPVDIQCASQAIDTLLLFSDIAPGCAVLAERTACWYAEHMQAKDGHFFFRKYPLGISNKAPMIHWGQATMHKALANLMLHLQGQGRGLNISF
jgi:hypothetical protein